MQLVTLFNINSRKETLTKKKLNQGAPYMLSSMHAVGWVMNALHIRNRVLACLKCMKNRLYSLKKMCFDIASENIHFKKMQTMNEIVWENEIENKKKMEKVIKEWRISLNYSLCSRKLNSKCENRRNAWLLFSKVLNFNETKKWILTLEIDFCYGRFYF